MPVVAIRSTIVHAHEGVCIRTASASDSVSSWRKNPRRAWCTGGVSGYQLAYQDALDEPCTVVCPWTSQPISVWTVFVSTVRPARPEVTSSLSIADPSNREKCECFGAIQEGPKRVHRPRLMRPVGLAARARSPSLPDGEHPVH